jgi:hypothetical protein
MKSEKLNPYRHFFLYAKGWYEKNDTISDLRILCKDFNYNENASLWDIQTITLDAIKEIMPKRFIDTERYVELLSQKSRINYLEPETYPLVIGLIKTNLHIMASTTKDMIEEFGLIGEPNYNLLPESEDCIRSHG